MVLVWVPLSPLVPYPGFTAVRVTLVGTLLWDGGALPMGPVTLEGCLSVSLYRCLPPYHTQSLGPCVSRILQQKSSSGAGFVGLVNRTNVWGKCPRNLCHFLLKWPVTTAWRNSV